jgi:hypothetical protein
MTFKLDPYASAFAVSVDPGAEDVGAALERRLGDLVSITYGAHGRLSRFNDSEPHWGGAAIGATMWGPVCTSAFTVILLDSGNRGSVTAGHCPFVADETLYSGSHTYGKLKERHPRYPLYDMSSIRPNGQSFQNAIWTDDELVGARTVVGRSPAADGQLECGSGQVTKNICNLLVIDPSTTYCDAEGCTSDVVELYRGGDVIVRPGDSGGPLFERVGSSNANISGMIFAGGVQSGSGYKYMYAERISNIRVGLNVEVATS